jgi:hypothetical protein
MSSPPPRFRGSCFGTGFQFDGGYPFGPRGNHARTTLRTQSRSAYDVGIVENFEDLVATAEHDLRDRSR